MDGLEPAIDLATGTPLPQTPFADLEAKYGKANVSWGQDKLNNRRENTGFANAIVSSMRLRLAAWLWLALAVVAISWLVV